MKIVVKSARSMQQLGANIAQACEPGCVIYLHGDLGAGKTTLVRGFLRGLGYDGRVRSPTFTLLETYQFAAVTIYHLDLYRLTDAEELAYIGGRDFFTEQTICLIEWPERGSGFLPPADLSYDFEFAHKMRARKITIHASSPKGESVIKKMCTMF